MTPPVAYDSAARVTSIFDLDTKRAIRTALSREAYERNSVRIVDGSVEGFDWLVASNRHLYAVSPTQSKIIMHGWFFGLVFFAGNLFLFENCALRDRNLPMGRIVRLQYRNHQFEDPQVIVKGLNANCHQIAVIDGKLCIVDTANQAVLRYSLHGVAIDQQRPFPHASPGDRSGAYLHINSIARVGDRIGLMLHNGNAVPEKRSEIAWLDRDWQVVERADIDGYMCHDIVADGDGTLWHSASKTGEIISSDGRRFQISDRLMTRGIAFRRELVAVGLSTFGPRQVRDFLGGEVVILRTDFTEIRRFRLRGSPADIVQIARD